MKRTLALLLALVLSLTACGFALAQTAAKEGMKIGLTAYDLTNPYWVMLVNGAQDRAEELGIELIVNDPKSDPSQQMTALENFLTMDVDAIIVGALDIAACEGVLKQAREKGVKIVAQSTRTDTRDVWVSAEEYNMGYVCGEGLGKWLLAKYGADAAPTVAVLAWDVIPTIIPRGDGLVDGIKAYVPGANVIRQNANTPALGQSVADSLLQAYPDLVGIACANDAGAIGAYSAVQAAKRDGDDFYIGGIDATDEALAIIKKGMSFRATVDLIPYENGAIDVDLCVKLASGEAVEDPYVVPAALVSYEDLIAS